MPGRPAREWERLVREFEASGMTRAEFARSKGVNVSTLAWWRSRFRVGRQLPVAPPAAFVALEVVEPRDLPALTLRFDRVDAVLHIGTEVDLRRLRAVVDALC